VLAHIPVGARSLVVEDLPVLVGDARDHVVEGTRHDDLSGIREAADLLRDVEPVADDLRMAVHVERDAQRPEVDADAHRAALVVRAELRRGVVHRVAELQADDERLLGVAEEADRGAVTGVEDDAVLGGDLAQRLHQELVERLLDLALLRDRALRVADEVHAHHAADEGAVCLHLFRSSLPCALDLV
jgi:hypothetical protein